MSDDPPKRTHAVVVVVAIVVVDVARGRDQRKRPRQPAQDTARGLYGIYRRARSDVRQAIAIFLTSDTRRLQYPAEPSLSIESSIDSSMKKLSSSQ